jgi:membrane protein implicated in regulation of membrane protease activity
MNKLKSHAFLIAGGMLFLPVAANAYVGPGAGLSLLGALWALVVAVAAAIAFLFAWPIRRMRRRKREARELEERQQAEPARPAAEGTDQGRNPGGPGHQPGESRSS